MSKALGGKSPPFNRHFLFPFRQPQALTGKKNPHIETLRGVAIIFIVMGHMIGYSSTGGMRVSDDSFFRYLHYSLEYIRLPLFTVISGWVYANKPVLRGDEEKFIKGKFRRLIVPMFFISTLLFLFRMVIPGTNTKPEVSELPRNLIFPYDVYWYLFSLFIIFLIITLLDVNPFFHTMRGWLLTLAGGFLLLFVSENFLDPVPNIWSFKGAAYLFPFFLTGIGLHRYKGILLHEKAALATITGLIIQQLAWFGYVPFQERHSLLGLTVGLSGVLLLFRLKLTNSFLVWIGGYAYTIFLFHVFFTGGSRIILSRAGIENQFAMLLLGTFAAIFFSILLDTLIKRSEVLRLYLLGLQKNEK
jgi:fucose 4-O-acetylase-like acetyltransferase